MRPPTASLKIRVFGLAISAVLGLVQLGASAQDAAPSAPAKPLRVYLESVSLDLMDALRSVAYMEPSSRLDDAQVAVMVANTGPDGYLITFTGRGEFQGRDDSLTYAVAPGQTEAEIRATVVQMIKLGLLRYVSKTPLAGRVTVALMDQVKPTSVADPWKFWVFSIGANSFANGEKSYKSGFWMGNFSANRVTLDWKIRLSLNGSYQKDVFSLEDYDYRSTSQGLGFSGLVVKSLSEHWSAGGFFLVNSSTYQNLDLSVIPAAAVEYNLFPYAESTKRQFRFLYQIGLTRNRYLEETIYDKTRETLLAESLTATLEMKRPWGTISASLEGQHFFHDFSKNRLQLEAEISFRLFKGLNFNIDGSGSRVHDQLYLAKGGASLEEVLLQRRQLATTYNYYFSVGISYTFGSIFSNIVNPRFGSGSGMSMSVSF